MKASNKLALCICSMAMFTLAGCNDDNNKDSVNPSGGSSIEEDETVDTCSNSTKDGTETDVDCGGECDACAVGKACVAKADCGTDAACVGGICVKAACTATTCDRLDLDDSCSDGIKNNDETDVDCGGSCDACIKDEACSTNIDCESGVCENGICAGTKAKHADLSKLIINEVLAMPKSGQKFAIQTNTDENEYIEIVNIDGVPVSVDGLALSIEEFNGTSQYTEKSKRISLSGVIPANGVMVVSEKPIPMPKDGINVVALNKSLKDKAQLAIRIIDNSNSSKGEYVIFGTKAKINNYSSKGQSHNRPQDLSSSSVVILKEHNVVSSKNLLNSPGYCANGNTFSDGCGTKVGELLYDQISCDFDTERYNYGCPGALKCVYSSDNDTTCGLPCKKDDECPNDNYCDEVCVSHSNGIIDGGESDVDCGGDDQKYEAARCEAGLSCYADEDCASMNCVKGTCSKTCDASKCDGTCKDNVCIRKDAECTTGEGKCNGNTPINCIKQQWVSGNVCSNGYTCSNGRCLAPEPSCSEVKCKADTTSYRGNACISVNKEDVCGCEFDTSCNAGFKCDKTNKVCVSDNGSAPTSEAAIAGSVTLTFPEKGASLDQDDCSKFTSIATVKTCMWNADKSYTLVLKNNAIVDLHPSRFNYSTAVLKQPSSDYSIQFSNLMPGYQVDVQWKVEFAMDKWQSNQLMLIDTENHVGTFTADVKGSWMDNTYYMDKKATGFTMAHKNAGSSNVLNIKSITVRENYHDSDAYNGCENSICAAMDDEHYGADVCFTSGYEGGIECGCESISDCKSGYECSDETSQCSPTACTPADCAAEDESDYQGNICIVETEPDYGTPMRYECGCESNSDCRTGFSCSKNHCVKN